MSEKTLGERAIILMVGRVVAVVVGIATPMVLVRVFTQTEFGAYRQINLAVMTVIGILAFGFPQSLFYFFPKYPSRRRTFVSQALFSQVIFGCIFLGITLFTGEALARFFKHEIFLIASPLIGGIALFQMTRSIMESLLIVEKRVAWASLYIVLRDVLRGLALVIVVLTARSLIALVYTLLIFEGVAFSVVILYSAIRYHIFRFRFSKDDFREQTRYSVPMGIGKGAADLTERLDQFLIVDRFTPADYAVYSQGAFPMRFFNIPHQSIFDIVIPNVVTLIKDGKRDELIRFWHDLVSKLAVITIPVVVLSQVVGVDAMVLLFTEEYRFSGALFQVYVFVLLRYLTAYAVLPRSYARTRLIMKSTFAALAVMLVAGWLGTVYFGMFGTVSAMLLSQYLHGFIQLQSGRRDIGLPWKQFLPWSNIFRTAGVAVAAAILPTVAALVIPSMIGRLAVCIPVFVAGYLAGLRLTGVYDWYHDPTVRKVLIRYLPFLSRSKNSELR